MVSAGEQLGAARLSQRLHDAIQSGQIGGALVLRELGDLASICVSGQTAAQDTVAFALSETFREHAEDKDERIVTGGDNYLLVASGGEHLSEAVKFIEKGGSPDDAVRIVANLARLTPDRLYGRWPPQF
jgi:hypothetical protein